jgi:hypothetical protein
MIVYITKYALTKGITKQEGGISLDNSNLFVARINARITGCYHTEGKDWHRTFEAASARAHDMRVSKIKSLKRSLAKMESLEFKEPA